ncbi:hypothetical protein [Streptomyces bacillaris]|uniref:hypothetical protein n=1 Tax=Streptomyces bacillaris TaxID=68179 RepID=UPI0036CE0BDE
MIGLAREAKGPPQARVVPVAVTLGAGLLLGLVGPVVEKWGNPICVALGLIFSAGWPWVCYAFLAGYFSRSKIRSSLLPAVGLAIGVIVYYLWKSASPATPDGLEVGASGEGISSKIFVWGVAAFVFGAPLGFLGNVARVPGVGGLPFRLLVPLVAIYEASVRLATEVNGQSAIVAITWNGVRFAAIAVAAILVGHTAWSWWRGRGNHRSLSGKENSGGSMTSV